MIYGTPEFDNILIKILKPTGKDGEGYRHPTYKETCDHAEEMSWHMYGVKPEKLLRRVRPREDPEVTEYRLDNYEPTTKSAADKAIHITSKIFNPNLYSIRWKDENDSSKKLKDYTLEYYPHHNSIVNFAKDVLLRKMLADPNAVLAVKVLVLPENDSKAPEDPYAMVYGSPSIWNFDEDHYLINTKQEEERKGQRLITWFYFEYYDRTEYVDFRCYITPRGELILEEIETYSHQFGQIPVWRLQGMNEALDNGEIIYKSFFASAIPYWNLSIIHESDVLGAYINHIHPLRVEISENCNFKWEGRFTCRHGKITKDDGESFDCPNCSGTGYKPMGPYGVFKISKEKLQEGDGPLGQPAVSYVSVPIDATKMLEERAARMQQKGMWAINMDVEDEIGQNQSGVAKVIDRSAQYDTLYNIGSVMFDVHIENMYYFFNKYMFGIANASAGKDAEANLPEVNKPTQFDIASTSELVNNYKAAKDSGLDPNYLQIKQIEIGTRDLTTNPDLKMFTNLLLDLDPLPGMDAQTVSLNVSKFFVSQVDAVIHFNLKRFLERAFTEDPAFNEKSKDEQQKVLNKYGQEMVKANKPVIDPTLLNYATQQIKAKSQAPAPV